MSAWTQADLLAAEARLRAAARQPVATITDSPGVEREADLHDQISAECRKRGWIALHGSMARATARTLGEPDYVLIADSGRIFLIECKARLTKISVEQQALHMQAARLGHTVHVVRNFEQFLEITKTQNTP